MEAGCAISVDNGWQQLPLEILTHSIHTGRKGVPVHKASFSLLVVPVGVGMEGQV